MAKLIDAEELVKYFEKCANEVEKHNDVSYYNGLKDAYQSAADYINTLTAHKEENK